MRKPDGQYGHVATGGFVGDKTPAGMPASGLGGMEDHPPEAHAGRL